MGAISFESSRACALKAGIEVDTACWINATVSVLSAMIDGKQGTVDDAVALDQCAAAVHQVWVRQAAGIALRTISAPRAIAGQTAAIALTTRANSIERAHRAVLDTAAVISEDWGRDRTLCAVGSATARARGTRSIAGAANEGHVRVIAGGTGR